MVDFFYHARGSWEQASHRMMMQSLLHHLLAQEPSLFLTFQTSFRRVETRSVGCIELTHEDLKDVFLSLRHDFAFARKNSVHNLFLVVDAMDENENENDRRRRQTVSALSTLCSSEGRHTAKVVFFSRPANKIEKERRKVRHIDVQKENGADIETIVDARLDKTWESG